jgi:tetratricopeptide (TPR) repeat protein
VRAVVVLLAATQICWRASAASAETQVKAEDCSSAVSGTVIGSHIEIHCLSKEDIERVVDELVRQGVVKRAEDAGIETSVIVSLAARLNPRQKFDFAQAVVEVSSAVDIAIKIAKEGASGSSDQLVDEVVKRIAEKTKDNDAAGATREAEEGFARWEKQEAERRTNATATGVALLEAALKTDLLRFDAGTAAGRVEKMSLLQHEGDSTARLGVIRTWFAQFYVEGMDNGVNFSLEVAIAIARREIALAEGPDQHGAALGDLGLALTTLGGRENGTARLKEAIETHRAALQELSRESTPFDWAKEQNNLGNALSQLGDRESGTERYEEAIRAYRQALAASTREQAPLDWGLMENNLGAVLYKVGKYDDAVAADRAAMEEWTRERVPLQWAMAQTNLALALAALGTKGGTAKLEEAVAAYRSALEELTRQRVPMRWAQTMTGLGIVLQLLGLREAGGSHLEEAIAHFRAALEEWTRDRDPQGWAEAQYHLATALEALGERESGTSRLEEAVAAYGAALQERTRERDPPQWAGSLGGQGLAMILIADRTKDSAMAKAAVQQIRTAFETLRDGGQQQWASQFGAKLPKAEAIRDRLKGQ